MFKEASAQNFMRFKNVTLPLENQGLTLILGRNEDAEHAGSNGAGKTSLLDVLTWGVWGTTVRNQKHDEVVNETVGKNCHVEVKLHLDGADYQIDRYRKCDYTDKPNDLTLTKNGEDVSGASMDATQALIDQLLGLDFPTFQCMMPGAGLKAAELTDSKIKSLLEKLLRTEAMATAHGLAKDKAKELNHKCLQLAAELGTLSEKIEVAEAKKEGYQEKIANEHEEAEARREELEERLASTESLLMKETAVRDAGESANRELLDSMDQFKEASEAHVLSLKAVRDAATLHEINKGTYNNAVYSADKDRARVESSINNFESHCSHCGQEIPLSKREEVMAKLEAQKAYLAGEAARNLREFDDWKDKSLQLLDTLKQEAREKGEVNDALQSVRESLEARKRAGEAAQRLIQTYTAQLAQIRKDSQAHEKYVSPYHSLLSEVTFELGELTKRQLDLQKQLELKQAEVEQYEFWVDGFSAKGLRNHMLKSVAPVLNAAAAKYSQIITGGEITVTFNTEKVLKSGEAREEFSIQVATKNGASSYKGSSTGEKARIDIIIAFALGDLAQKRAQKKVPFRFLDEPFENIDEEGNEAILSLLQNQEDYSTVYCITHKQSFQQLFNKHLLVVKKDGVSRLERVTP